MCRIVMCKNSPKIKTYAQVFLTLSIKVSSILEKYIQILCYPYSPIIYKKNFDFTVGISEK